MWSQARFPSAEMSTNSTIVAGNDNSPDAEIGKVPVGRRLDGSSLVVGVQNLGADDLVGGTGANADNVNFGDSHDVKSTKGSAAIVASIASIVIGGTVNGSANAGDHFGFVAEQIGSFTVAGFLIPLSKTAKDNLVIGNTGDLTIHEL